MAKITFVLLCIGFLGFVSGCNQQNQTSLPQQAKSEKILKQTPFPQFLVGTWKSADPEKSLWEFTFEADGRISLMQNFLGVYMSSSDGQTYEQIAKADTEVEIACALGPVQVNYDQNTRRLSVKVVTDYYMLYVVGQMIEASSVDTISGTISQDGSTWEAEWQSISGMHGAPLDFNSPTILHITLNKVITK